MTLKISRRGRAIAGHGDAWLNRASFQLHWSIAAASRESNVLAVENTGRGATDDRARREPACAGMRNGPGRVPLLELLAPENIVR